MPGPARARGNLLRMHDPGAQLNIDPESLFPKLPRPRDLRPFPTAEALRYEGHTGKVRSLSVDPSGQWLATGTLPTSPRVTMQAFD